MSSDLSRLAAEIAAINTDKVTATRVGYEQHFKEIGSRLTHYLVRLSDGERSPEAGYSSITGLDGLYSVSGYFLAKEDILTAQEFCDAFAVSE